MAEQGIFFPYINLHLIQNSVAFNSFLEVAILQDIFIKISCKIATSKEKHQTYLLPSLKIMNHSLTGGITSLNSILITTFISPTLLPITYYLLPKKNYEENRPSREHPMW